MIQTSVELQSYLGGYSVTIKHMASHSYCEFKVRVLKVDATIWAMLENKDHCITAADDEILFTIYEDPDD